MTTLRGSTAFDGFELAPTEKIVVSAECQASNILFFRRWRIGITDRRLITRMPWIALEIIPMGSRPIDLPLSVLDAVKVQGHNVSRAILGLVGLLGGVWALFLSPSLDGTSVSPTLAGSV